MHELIYHTKLRRLTWDNNYYLLEPDMLTYLDNKISGDRILIDNIWGVIGVLDNYFIYVKKCELRCNYNDVEFYHIKEIGIIPLVNDPTNKYKLSLKDKLLSRSKLEKKIHSKEKETMVRIKKFIENHNFYVSHKKIEDDRFIWNTNMINNNISTQIYLFCGYINSKVSYRYTTTILSFISKNRIGPRFICRGVDDDGNSSFFVKTICQVKRDDEIINEKILYRGSIPVYWEQKLSLRQEIKIYDKEHKIPFKKHFKVLQKENKKIFVINLLSSKINELKLTEVFEKNLKENEIEYCNFDMNKYHLNFTTMKKLFHYLLKDINEECLFRVNCLDCLDRTNLAQYLICDYYFSKTGYNFYVSNDLKKLWVDNGNALSYFYTGSDAQKSELAAKGKRSISGLLDDLYITTTRMINGSFTDKIKREIIDKILGKDKIKKDVKEDE
ncbi:Phosphoinositide polyphosphatase [Spraguea lophii 42_110]|uniref:Phosphoinositide polyphosphatase n=1 Tax=Spraguea lophii (strain 42_110) TaxID=1358809 RepID=S7W911_SPRLO|nr:Phosphoinositide polyphosphatase [Spraguea lophii 42_110]